MLGGLLGCDPLFLLINLDFHPKIWYNDIINLSYNYMSMENPSFLKNKYNNLHNSPEVKAAVRSKEVQTDEKVPQNPEKQIQYYLDRLERLVLDPDKEQPRKLDGTQSRPRALSLLREMVIDRKSVV